MKNCKIFKSREQSTVISSLPSELMCTITLKKGKKKTKLICLSKKTHTKPSSLCKNAFGVTVFTGST